MLSSLLVLVPGGIGIGTWIEARDLQRLVDAGVAAQARVDGLRRSSRRGSSKYLVDYSFVVDGQRFTGSDGIGKARWEALQVGKELLVCYWPPDPQIHRVGRVSPGAVGSAQAWGWTGVLLSAAAFGVWLALFERRLRRSLALLRDGQAIAGSVVRYDPPRRRRKARVAYRFATPGGGTTEGIDRLDRLDPPPQPGAEIIVLQSRDDPTLFASLPRVLEYAEFHRDSGPPG